MIIAFSGNKFAGKDTAAQILINKCGFTRIGLADKLKDICSEVFQISRKDMDDPSKKESLFTKKLIISAENIDLLLQRMQKDGFEFNFEITFRDICKDFCGKTLTTIRDMLQTIGTDICRNFIQDNIWLEYIKKNITNYDKVVITDARFKNERDFLKQIGAVLILVKRPGYENTSTHISENQLGKDADYDVIVKNDTTEHALQSGIHTWYSIKYAT